MLQKMLRIVLQFDGVFPHIITMLKVKTFDGLLIDQFGIETRLDLPERANRAAQRIQRSFKVVRSRL
jgi:hypothetical protein